MAAFPQLCLSPTHSCVVVLITEVTAVVGKENDDGVLHQVLFGKERIEPTDVLVNVKTHPQEAD